MALAQELASFNIDSIKTSLKGAVKTIKVDAKIDLDIHVATGLTDAVAAAQKIIEKADPKQLEAAVRTMLEELQQLAALPEIHTVVEVSSSFERIAAMLRLVAERAGVDPDAIVEQISEGTGLQQVIADLVKRFVDSMPAKLPDEIRVPIEGLQKFVSGDPADAAELADVLARFLVGVDLHSLGEPSLSINASASLLASAGGDFGPIAAHITALTANVRAITLQLRAAQPDVPSIVLAILAVSDGLDLLFDELRPAMARLTAAFNGIDIAPIVARVEAALRPIVALVPNLTFDLMRTTVAPLRALGSGIDSLTAQQLDALFADVEARLRHALQTSALGEATRLLDLYRDLAIERLRAIGIGRLRNEVVSALSAVEARINRFGFQAADAFAAQIDALGKGIAGLDVQPIRDAVAAVKAKIKQIEDTFPINQLNTDVGMKIKDVQELAGKLLDKLKKIETSLDGLTTQVNAIDFAAAADDTRRLMGEIRSAVEKALNLPGVGAAVHAALAAAAQPLKQIDLRVDVGGKISGTLDSFDPAAILAPLQPVLDQLRTLLQSVAPGALIEQLDKPFVDAVSALEQYKPSALLATLESEFKTLTSIVDKADPKALVMPLQSEFDKIVEQVRKAANPDPLFEPLERVYAKILEGFDAADPEKLLGSVVTKVAELPQAIGAGLQTAVAAHTAGAAVETAAVVPFRFGDLIRPFAALVTELRQRVEALPKERIGGAFAALLDPIAALRLLADPEHGYLGRLAAAIDARVALLLPDQNEGPFAELLMSIHELQITAEARADLSADAHLQLGSGMASLRITGRFMLLASVRAELDVAVTQLRLRVAPPHLTALLREAVDALERFIPRPLLDLSAMATAEQQLDALFGALDLQPIVVELDAISDKVNAKFTALAADAAKGVIGVIDLVFTAVEDVMPLGLLRRLQELREAVRTELMALDPAPIRAEAHRLVDSVINVLERFSPNAIAERLDVVLQAVKKKLAEVSPAALVGDATELDKPFEDLAKLRPSIVLGPLATSAKDLQKQLDVLLELHLGEALVKAVVRLRAEVEAALDAVFVELQDLIALLENSGGGVNVSASASFAA